jgi:hypothetical protein
MADVAAAALEAVPDVPGGARQYLAAMRCTCPGPPGRTGVDVTAVVSIGLPPGRPRAIRELRTYSAQLDPTRIADE